MSAMINLMRGIDRDVLSLAILAVVASVSRRTFIMRGVTYRSTVPELWKDRAWKSFMYVGLLGFIDALLRRSGQILSLLGVPIFPRSERLAMILRLVLLHGPWVIWAIQGPLSTSTRDDKHWSDSATRASIWFRFGKLFKSTNILLSEEWVDLSEEQRERWRDRHYVIGMHPHGLLPFGAILSGLTWAGGGLRGTTTSGAEVPEVSNPGPLLHQRFFRHMKLRAAVASGAVGCFPGVFEMFTKLGAFECTKPFIVERLREDKDVAIFSGGASESAFACPGRYVMYAKHKGFVRLALEERRDILPMWCFGDESAIPQARNPPRIWKCLTQFFKEATGLLIPPAIVGLRFPHLTLVTGVPVSLEDLWPEKVGTPVSDQAVEEGHKRYMQAQKQLFDRNKALVPGGHENGVLEFAFD